jgi:hypothetical protein
MHRATRSLLRRFLYGELPPLLAGATGNVWALWALALRRYQEEELLASSSTRDVLAA